MLARAEKEGRKEGSSATKKALLFMRPGALGGPWAGARRARAEGRKEGECRTDGSLHSARSAEPPRSRSYPLFSPTEPNSLSRAAQPASPSSSLVGVRNVMIKLLFNVKVNVKSNGVWCEIK